jgi:hypothetical protein
MRLLRLYESFFFLHNLEGAPIACEH